MVATYWKLVLMSIGCPKNAGTASSINEWDFMKLRVMSGRVRESLTHWPGLGSGTWGFKWRVLETSCNKIENFIFHKLILSQIYNQVDIYMISFNNLIIQQIFSSG